MNERVKIVVSLWLRTHDIARFEAFESQAAAIMQRHGGQIDQVIRRNEGSAIDAPFEVHVLSFPGIGAFEAYREDPELLEMVDERNQLIENTVVFVGQNQPSYSG